MRNVSWKVLRPRPSHESPFLRFFPRTSGLFRGPLPHLVYVPHTYKEVHNANIFLSLRYEYENDSPRLAQFNFLRSFCVEIIMKAPKRVDLRRRVRLGHFRKRLDRFIPLTKTSYWIRMTWQPLRLVGGSGGTKSFSFFQSSVELHLILPRLTEDSSRVSVSMILLLVMYWMV